MFEAVVGVFFFEILLNKCTVIWNRGGYYCQKLPKIFYSPPLFIVFLLTKFFTRSAMYLGTNFLTTVRITKPLPTTWGHFSFLPTLILFFDSVLSDFGKNTENSDTMLQVFFDLSNPQNILQVFLAVLTKLLI